MADIYCFSYVEDAPTEAIMVKLVEENNKNCQRKIHFHPGFPYRTGGYGKIKVKCPAFLNMANAGQFTLVITDLDTHACPPVMIRDWFGIPEGQPIDLPDKIIFRIAVGEVEAWVLADLNAWATFIGIPAVNFEPQPDSLPNPKQHLLNVLRKKGKQRRHKDILPTGSAHVGPRYNEILCGFINNIWDPIRAMNNSPSLERAVKALRRICKMPQ